MSEHMQAVCYLEEMTCAEVRAYLKEARALLLLPVGVTEPHGDHLPVGTDNYGAIGVCERLSRETGLAIAPSLLYGYHDRMITHPGAVTLSRETYRAVLGEALEQLVRMGAQFLVVANGHGPNHEPLLEAIRPVVARHRARFLVVEWWHLTTPHLEELFGTSDIGHGGLAEVAAMRRYRPELVHLERVTADSFTTSRPGVIAFPYARTAVVDDASLVLGADSAKLAEVMARVEEEIVALVRDALADFRRSLEEG